MKTYALCALLLASCLMFAGCATVPGETLVTPRPHTEYISICLEDVDLYNTILLFSSITGARIIATPSDLEERYCTVDLDDAHWQEALGAILSEHNLKLEERPTGFYRVERDVGYEPLRYPAPPAAPRHRAVYTGLAFLALLGTCQVIRFIAKLRRPILRRRRS